MMEFLRKAATTWIAKLLLILLVASFAVWGVSGTILSGTTTTTVSAGETKVGLNEYRFAYEQQLSNLSRQFGKRLTREQARGFGVEQSVMNQMVTGAVLDESARKMGLNVSDETLAAMIGDDPAFRDAGGKFDRNQLRNVLYNAGINEDTYIGLRKQELIRSQFVQGISSNLSAPQVFAKALALFENQTRKVEYVLIGAEDVKAPETPADDVLEAWFKDNKDKYRAPEYRTISYVKLEPKDISNPSAITDEEIKKDYEANLAKYTTPEKRDVQQIIFKTRDEAKKAARSLINGEKTFIEVAKEQGKTPEQITFFQIGEKDLPDPAMTKIAFELQQDKPSGVIDGAFGPLLVNVTKITPESVKPLDEVKDEIRDALALQKAADAVFEAHDLYEDERAAGASMQEAAKKADLKVETIAAIDRKGLDKEGKVVADIPQSAQLIAEAFQAPEKQENAPLQLGTNGFVWYEVDAIEAPRDKELSEVKDQVVKDWIQAETEKEIKVLADKFVERAKAGETFEKLASEMLKKTAVKVNINKDADKESDKDSDKDANKDAKKEDKAKKTENLSVAANISRAKTSGPLKRSLDGGDLGRDAVITAFSNKAGEVLSTPAKDPAQIAVFRVIEVKDGNEMLSDAKSLDRFNQAMQNDLLLETVNELREHVEVEINQSAINTALSN